MGACPGEDALLCGTLEGPGMGIVWSQSVESLADGGTLSAVSGLTEYDGNIPAWDC